MTTCSPGFSIGFARTCLQAGIPVKVASLWLWRKRMGEAMEKPAFANAFLAKAASVEGGLLPVIEKSAVDRSIIHQLSAEIADIDKRASQQADPKAHGELMLVRDEIQRRLNAYVMGE